MRTAYEDALLRQAHTALRSQPRRPRNAIHERIAALDWECMAYDRSTPLPSTVSLEHLLQFFQGVLLVQLADAGALGSEVQQAATGGRDTWR